ncbi:MAG: phytanoyl-CoA dioxygenase family protein [Gammaproteobacteria bacterium]|nr:phytanoyl-CoA dioxygenase family protein [Gammaproteobacteria bacterium]
MELNQFQNDGVIVFKNLIDGKKIEVIQLEIAKIRDLVMKKISKMDRPLKNYSDIAERQLGRLDYRCGFTADIFNVIAQPIIDIVNSLSPHVDFRHYWGAIPSLASSGPTDLHRDIYPILNTTEGNDLDKLDLNLPPYYFTVLMPLVEITKLNGPTEFIKGSHKKMIAKENTERLYAPLLSPGDVVIFDGRTLHRGSANQSQDERLVAYITFVAKWYHDQTFEINDYLFPELL